MGIRQHFGKNKMLYSKSEIAESEHGKLGFFYNVQGHPKKYTKGKRYNFLGWKIE